ncbi:MULTISPECIES: rodlin [Streptomyces]|uniref:RdlA protein n=2 Tax=Streptomyces rimosus subsp. rimosus TaxID=132474 RepID=L8ELP7_STRR1|nr:MULTISPECIES: rodlin [Streptomyces]KOG72797.1 RdlA protein [Kitasatospora aureofaciens]MYT44673.1 RdlA protein [Streptomyces sp. SID5471]KEF04551.1 RdlA protein [Streptomyces rimosus]KEF20133.1 RdlA protein [Streptomyces rimosus]KOT34086.1 RdlA protein [Streptomyces sp. NRRL WC-3701]
MIKKALATVATAASVVGIAAAAAPEASAVGDARKIGTYNGNGAAQVYGNMSTMGNMSPQFALIQGSFNKPCIALPVQDVQNLVSLVNIGVQDILSSDQTQTCVENSSQVQGDGPLSHLIDKLPILSVNGTNNE